MAESERRERTFRRLAEAKGERLERARLSRFARRILADEGVNLATMRVTRKERGGDAFMVLELDDPPSDRALAQIRKLEWVRMTRALDKVSG